MESTPVERKGSQQEGKETERKLHLLVCQEVSVGTSADPIESSEAGRTPQSCLELGARG